MRGSRSPRLRFRAAHCSTTSPAGADVAVAPPFLNVQSGKLQLRLKIRAIRTDSWFAVDDRAGLCAEGRPAGEGP